MSDSPTSPEVTSASAHVTSPSANVVQFPLLQILLLTTALNFCLIFGGTIYSQITVNSIQKTFQEAESRLNDSKAKYSEASAQLEQQRARAAQTRSEIDSLVKSFDKVESQLSELKKESARKLDSIADEARAQLTQLKTEKASIGNALQVFEAEVKGTVAQNSAKIRSEVEVHMSEARGEISKSKDRLQLLSTEIAEQKAIVDKRNLEIQQFQLTSNRTLESVRETDKSLKQEISSLRQGRGADPMTIWTHSDWVLRSIYIGLGALTLLSLAISLWAVQRSKAP